MGPTLYAKKMRIVSVRMQCGGFFFFGDTPDLDRV